MRIDARGGEDARLGDGESGAHENEASDAMSCGRAREPVRPAHHRLHASKRLAPFGMGPEIAQRSVASFCAYSLTSGVCETGVAIGLRIGPMDRFMHDCALAQLSQREGRKQCTHRKRCGLPRRKRAEPGGADHGAAGEAGKQRWLRVPF